MAERDNLMTDPEPLHRYPCPRELDRRRRCTCDKGPCTCDRRKLDVGAIDKDCAHHQRLRAERAEAKLKEVSDLVVSLERNAPVMRYAVNERHSIARQLRTILRRL